MILKVFTKGQGTVCGTSRLFILMYGGVPAVYDSECVRTAYNRHLLMVVMTAYYARLQRGVKKVYYTHL